MRLRLTKPAQREFDQAVEWFKTNRPWLGERFLDDLQRTFDQLAADPLRFPRVEIDVADSSRQWRRAILKRFSYIVAYFIDGETVVICTIRHTSRDWTSQL